MPEIDSILGFFMNKLYKIIKSLTVGMTWQMAKALLSKPHLLLPTIWGTIESILFAELKFQEAHGGQGIANAFRHSAWNLLIARNCALFTSKTKAADWAKYTTDLHEEVFPNDDFDREMDLHNNRVGRELFLEWSAQKLSKNKMIDALYQKTKTAVGLTDEKEMANYPNELVFLKTYGQKTSSAKS